MMLSAGTIADLLAHFALFGSIELSVMVGVKSLQPFLLAGLTLFVVHSPAAPHSLTLKSCTSRSAGVTARKTGTGSIETSLTAACHSSLLFSLLARRTHCGTFAVVEGAIVVRIEFFHHALTHAPATLTVHALPLAGAIANVWR
jgi:hypothetical protein